MLLLCMLPTAQTRAASAALTNTPVAGEHAAESIADTAIASQSAVYLKLSKVKGQQLTRPLIMPPSSVINVHTSPQQQQQQQQEQQQQQQPKLAVLNLCTPTLRIQTMPLCVLAYTKWSFAAQSGLLQHKVVFCMYQAVTV